MICEDLRDIRELCLHLYTYYLFLDSLAYQ
jgi:hypothetical protein